MHQTRLLVTHGIGFLPQCDAIIVMVDGTISELGTYDELLTANGPFAQFLHTHQSNSQAEEKDDGNHMNFFVPLAAFTYI